MVSRFPDSGLPRRRPGMPVKVETRVGGEISYEMAMTGDEHS